MHAVYCALVRLVAQELAMHDNTAKTLIRYIPILLQSLSEYDRQKYEIISGTVQVRSYAQFHRW